MKTDLSPVEQKVAEQYCRGLRDSEVADALGMMIWTCRTHKKRIFKKWGINTTHEMVLLCIAKLKNRSVSIKDIRERGLQFFRHLTSRVATLFNQPTKPNDSIINNREFRGSYDCQLFGTTGSIRAH